MSNQSKYPFEQKLRAWARDFSRVMTGRDVEFTWALDERGAARHIYLGEASALFDLDIKEAMAQAGQSLIFYNPAYNGNQTWLQWRRVRRPALERITGLRFEDADFVSFSGEGRIDDLPESWGVVFLGA